MAWITLTSVDVARRLAAAELNALKSAAKAAEQDGDEILAEAIADVTTKVRGYVGGCTRNKLGPSGTVPDELKSASLALVREFLFTRLPGMKSLYDELRQKETDRAYDDLRAAAACKLAILPPETEADDQPAGSPVELISGGTRRATRDRMRGLL
jgi:hypothetical protein